MEAEDHEQVVFCRDRSSGLRALIAIHDTTLGPSLGGVRLREYSSEEEALRDVLRLSQAMSCKASLAGLALGGGKAVVIGPLADADRANAFRALGRFVESLGGRYVPTEDMGTFTSDIERLRETSRFGVGLPAPRGGGDPSPMTAFGVLCGMRAAVEAAGLVPGLGGKRVVVQGVGKVGLALARLLIEAGAEVLVSDVSDLRLDEAKALGARIVANPEVHRQGCDVFAPCAGGAVLRERTIAELGCRIVAGGANNQLATDQDDDRLHARGILYAPDFAINAGGLINVADELEPGGYDAGRARARTSAIERTLRAIFAESVESGEPPGRIARRRALRRIEAARHPT